MPKRAPEEPPEPAADAASPLARPGIFVFVKRHVHARSAEGDALHAQAESLLGGLFSGQLDGAAGSDDAMPGQSRDLLQDAHDLPGRARPARRSSHGSVAGHGSLGQGSDAARDSGSPVFRSGVVRFFHRDAVYKRL